MSEARLRNIQMANRGSSSHDGVEGEDVYFVSQPQSRGFLAWSNMPQFCVYTVFVLLLITFIMAAVALGKASHSKSVSESKQDLTNEDTGIVFGTEAQFDTVQRSLIERIAFGSCSSYDIRELSIFPDGVMKVNPQAWIWLGDMVYLDKADFECPSNETQLEEFLNEDSKYEQCLCDPTWLHVPHACMAGDVQHAYRKIDQFLRLNTYRQFVDFMCPSYYTNRQAGSFPPIGIECERPILGTYDDHDFGWNDGDGRFPNKSQIKQLFLDAIGEPQNSARRSQMDGVQAQYVLNKDYPGKQIQVVLLDERYHRSPFPCQYKEVKCPDNVTENMEAQCNNLFGEGAECCTWDDEIQGQYCKNPTNLQQDPETCNTALADFAMKGYKGSPDGPICEVLGARQRQWLTSILQSSQASLHLIGSGSVVFGAGECGGDNWECFKPAQKNFIQTLANVTQGCVVILTGDYHHADIKMVEGGAQQYEQFYDTKNLKKPIYQLMSSGLSFSTANNKTCDDWRIDELGLRVNGNCAMYGLSNFGAVEVDWDQRVVSLSIRTDKGDIANDINDNDQLRVQIDLDSCKIIK